MQKYIYTLYAGLVLILSPAFTQLGAFITGNVTDSLTAQSLVGATILLEDGTGVATDTRGRFYIEVNPGSHTLIAQYIGYKPSTRQVTVKPGDSIWIDIPLTFSDKWLDEVVVSAGRYEQRLSEVTVSMEVIKPNRIVETNSTSLDQIIQQTPGVYILDGQPNIRSGSGYSYGTGSRVLMLYNDMPMLSADAGDIKWDFIPLENISQVEIIKGPSSVLYGSSALNGVINVRSSFAGVDPKTRIQLFSGVYSKPRRKETVWWDHPPYIAGLQMNHSRKLGPTDLVVGGSMFYDKGYRTSEYDKRGRINVQVSHRNRVKPGLSYGVRINGMYTDKSDFLLWVDADSGALQQNPSAISVLTGTRLTIDPFVEYYNEKGNRHQLNSRFFNVSNDFPDASDKDNSFRQFMGEYRYLKKIGGANLTSGVSGNYASIISNFYGDHQSLKGSLFSQLDMKYGRFNFSMGLRYEFFKLDNETERSNPVFRSGINWSVSSSTFLRASFGQGYRFPSVSEKYAVTQVGALNIFPNPDLSSESGWSAELGLKQGLKIGSWNGYFDLAGYITEYNNMIEYIFGLYLPDSVTIPSFDYLGFKSLNVRNARISGLEISFNGSGNIGPLSTTIQGGYNYNLPIDRDIPRPDSLEHILKYRFFHSAKLDLGFQYRNISMGIYCVYTSRMINVDEVFLDPVFGELILPGYAGYRNRHNEGYFILDHRVSYKIKDHSTLSIVTKNLLNKEYMGRPGDLRPPRTINFQYTIEF